MQDRIRRALDPSDLETVGAILSGLPERYFSAHTDDEIRSHGAAIGSLSDRQPLVVVNAHGAESHRGEEAVHCRFTICTRDAAGLFGVLSGVLGARGFNVKAGRIFTSESGVVADTFHGLLPAGTDFDEWIDRVAAELVELLRSAASHGSDTVRETVMEIVARAHAVNPRSDEPLLPINIAIDQEEEFTRVSVVSQDTPFFLYSLASALTLQDVSIQSLEIDTVGEEIHDTFWIQRTSGGPVDTPGDIERLKLSILVTKQFSHALDQAADPRVAFTRFEEIVRNVAIEGGRERLGELLADPEAQRELARLLGASDFLWEDFIRLQYESILPLLSDRHARRPFSTPSEALRDRLEERLAGVSQPDERRRVLNEFKDHESYLIDADHILQRNTDFFFLSHRLTKLAELVVDCAFRLAWETLTGRYGHPRSAAGLPAQYAVFGLGKMGGSALGYASDIELMTVYSDQGDTDGPPDYSTVDEAAGGKHRRRISNREFFEKLVVEAVGMIHSRREAIFEIDLRLRPYGNDGPKAVHLESFINYFGPAGKAHSAERLALIRLRHIAGDNELGRRVVAIRDQLIYESHGIRVAEIRDLRVRQAEEKVGDGRLNAKFSPGALVDLEYNVQLLQVERGRDHPELRNPGIHASLRTLSELGTIDDEEAEAMIRAYRFLRTLINGLRMLRGNAQDLFLPTFDSREAMHLARRMGYRDTHELTAAAQLRLDFEVETAAVRSFVERHLGQDAIPGLVAGNPADLVLSDSIEEERISRVLVEAGFRNPSRGIVNLRRMAGHGEAREQFARLVVLAWDYLRRSGDPDMALNNWDRFTEQVEDRIAFFRELLAQPRRMEIMLTIFAGSQFLSDTLIRTPAFLGWISDPSVVTTRREEHEIEEELLSETHDAADRMERLNALRRFRRREILRIGARDICLGGDFTEVVGEISALARSVVRTALFHARRDLAYEVGRFCILAFGKLGGDELNYSSDIDLLAIYQGDDTVVDQLERAGKLFRQVVRDLTDFTLEGQAYRVDLRLRPWGNAGRLVYAIPTLHRYYAEEADLWELQALIKLSPIAGDIELGRRFLEEIKPTFSRRLEVAGKERVLGTVRHLRTLAVKQHGTGASPAQPLIGADIKNGEGGIRDIEFLVQAIQMLQHRFYPEILTGNTLAALRRMEEAGILEAATVGRLRDDYLFLRRIEHFLQVYDDQQLHAIPAEPDSQAKLTRVVLGEAVSPAELLARLGETMKRVRAYYVSVVGEFPEA
ncbi:MAG: glutamate-ammonia-ligase adenylyltransferase [Spirochaetales bacterium]|nr:glutamate-ammonia-ligase adenylyltransferase [Spirochaetales bacterium]